MAYFGQQEKHDKLCCNKCDDYTAHVRRASALGALARLDLPAAGARRWHVSTFPPLVPGAGTFPPLARLDLPGRWHVPRRNLRPLEYGLLWPIFPPLENSSHFHI
jgi:hypothetical protein